MVDGTGAIRAGAEDASRLSGSDLALAAWRRVYLDPRTYLPFWSMFAVLDALQKWTWRAIAPPGSSKEFDFNARLLAYALVTGVAHAVVAGPALRRLLRPDANPWALDRGLLAYVALVTAASLAPTLLSSAAGSQGPAVLVVLAGYIVVIVACLRLPLWPVGKLMGDERMTVGHAWRLMRGGVTTYVSIVLRLATLPFLVSTPLAIFYYRGGAPGLVLLGAPFAAAMSLLGLAGLAELYRNRVATFEDPIAEIFD